MSNRRNDWSFRLQQELKYSVNGFFVTYTYDGDNIPESIDPETGEYYQTLEKRHFQWFMKRLREAQSRITDVRIRFYCVGEYGTETHRPHYHALLFNVHKELIHPDKHRQLWTHGNIYIGTLTDASIHYVTKYHVNRNPKHNKKLGKEPEFTLMSQGIGKEYILANTEWHKRNDFDFVISNGHKLRMPKYYKKKIWDEETMKNKSFNARLNATEQHALTVKKLKELGYQDPEEYIYECQLDQAKRVKHKRDKNRPMF